MHGRPETTGATTLDARRSAPGARCALPGARGRVRRGPGSVPPSTSPLSKPPRLCLCLCPPTPRLRLPPLRASAPAGRTETRPRAALAAGRAEGVGRDGGAEAGGGGRAPGPLRGPRIHHFGEERRGLGGGGVEQEAGAGIRSRDA